MAKISATCGPGAYSVSVSSVVSAVEETSVVIPARALHELARILSDTEEPVSIVLAHSRNQLLFHIDGVDLVSRLIDGQYPNYQSVLPASHATRAVLDREELLRAVRPAALIAHESANIVKLGVGLDGEAAITVSANAEIGATFFNAAAKMSPAGFDFSTSSAVVTPRSQGWTPSSST